MMQVLLLTFLFLSVNAEQSFLRVSENMNDWQQFNLFQTRFSKRYETIQELEHRFIAFRDNLRLITRHNLDSTQNFSLGINQFSDLSTEEFKVYHNNKYSSSTSSYGCNPFVNTYTDALNSIDWTTKNVVNPVRNQGQCGSCWAFATTSNAESVWAISKGYLTDLSEQYLVDCAKGIGYYNKGCNGGQPNAAFKYMINNGQCTEMSYPYTATDGACKKGTASSVKFSECFDVASNDQLALKAAVSKRPVVVAIEADTKYFQLYSGGILDAEECGADLDHAVEIVGYGTDKGLDYWKVRNSWDSSWGENGYVRIKRSSSANDIGICGIAAQPSFLSV